MRNRQNQQGQAQGKHASKHLSDRRSMPQTSTPQRMERELELSQQDGRVNMLRDKLHEQKPNQRINKLRQKLQEQKPNQRNKAENRKMFAESMSEFFPSKGKPPRKSKYGSQHAKEDKALRRKLHGGLGNVGINKQKQNNQRVEPLMAQILKVMEKQAAKPTGEKSKTPTKGWLAQKPSFSQNNNMSHRIRSAMGGSSWRRPRRRQIPRHALVAAAVEPETKEYVDIKTLSVTVPAHAISLSEVSQLFREKASVLKKILRQLGALAKEDEELDEDDIRVESEYVQLLAEELGRKYTIEDERLLQDDSQVMLQRRLAAEEESLKEQYDSFPQRPPVVCIMGHVDHGKTTLMDALRRRATGVGDSAKTKKKKKKAKKDKKKQTRGTGNVAGTEAGGITQVISAFQVPIAGEGVGAVSFLDTPGHAAFKSMRQSGSDAADVIVLVVAADDGISTQTIEIIYFYKSIIEGSGSSGISMVVAMNKIDKPGVDVAEARSRVENQLLEHGILVEGMPSEQEGEFGPPVQLFPVSGLTGEGLDDLVEGLVLQSEIMDLRADEDASCEGVVLDARVDKGLGIVADCIVRWGSVEKGDILVSGTSKAKVRILKDMGGMQLEKGVPSQPVRVVGFETVPKAGDPIICVETEEAADDLIERRTVTSASKEDDYTAQSSEAELQSAGKHLLNKHWRERFESKYGLDDDEERDQIRIPVIVRADADGTLAAIRDSLVAIADESSLEVNIDPVRCGVGPVQMVDIEMAKECGASIFCFNLKNELTTLQFAEEQGVNVVGSDVIYRLLESAKDEFVKHFPELPVEVVHGRAQVQAVFAIDGIDTSVAGLKISDGTFYFDKAKGATGTLEVGYRVLRNDKVISSEDALAATSLKHFKEDVREVGRGKECGLSLDGFSDYEAGDVLECFSIEMRREFA